MQLDAYPPQEPLSEPGRAYQSEVMRLGAGLAGEEHFYADDPYQGLSVFAAPQPTGAILAFLHGGGWTNGYKEWLAFMAPAFTAAGIVFASIGYRLAPQHLFPTGFEDACRGLAWLYENGGDYSGDRGRLFVGGHSAGGHYAALMAVRRDWQAARGLPGDVVRGCLPISGVYDFTEGSGLSMRPRFLGEGPTERAASPLYSIAGTPPPFLLAHGDRDFPHLMRQAEVMESALREAGGRVTRRVLRDRDHFSASYAGGEPSGPWVPAAIDWINQET